MLPPVFNDVTRRRFLQQLGFSAAGVLTTAIIGKQAYATFHKERNGNLVVRKNIAALTADDPSVKLLKDAVAILKKRSQKSPLDPTGWLAHVSQHATFCATNLYENQVHYSWFLLPWHRGYLYALEKKLQEAVREPKLALHYWDWTKNPAVPTHYWGIDNPMNNESRLIDPKDLIPNDFINIGAALRTPDFESFGGYPLVKNWDDQQRDGIAEQTFHNNLHNWIGGDMASFDNSGNDMIFTGHHGNVDRVWEAWLAIDAAHQNPGQNDWREHTFYYTDAKGRPLDIKVKDLTNTEKLGYTFDNLNLNPVFCNPLLENDCPAMIESDQHTKVTATVLPSPGHKIFNNAASNKYVRGQLHFERIELPYMPYCARVFFSYRDGDMYGAPNVQKYVGTFTILPIGKPYAGVLQKEVYFQIELDAGYANRLKNMEQVVVSLVPVALRNRSIPEDTIRLHSVKLQLNRS